MTAGGKLEGADEAIKAIDEELRKINKAGKAGAWDVALQIQAAAQRHLRDSVITGNLRASAYARAEGEFERGDPSKMISAKNISAPSDSHGDIWSEVGFTANYALYVHENMEGRAPKFLEEPVKRNKSKIPKIFEARMAAR